MAGDRKDWRKSVFKNYPSSKIPDLSGNIIDKGRLRLVEFIGQGSWGVVYKAQRIAAGSRRYPNEYYAVKCMSPYIMSSRQRKSIQNEILMHEACSYATRTVVKLVNVLEDENNGLICIVTELCEGGTLLDHIKDETVTGSDECIRRTFLQIIDAVAACHGAGIYHRDLKLENILFKADGTIVLGDFGFATIKRKTTDFGLGSREYMSPEVLGGFAEMVSSVRSAEADVWALGILLTVIVTGRMPWRKATGDDKHFRRYVKHDPDYIYNTFNVSAECNEILKSIFCHPRTRTTLDQLRKWVATAKTFRRDPKLDYLTKESEEKSVFECESDTDSEAPTPLQKPQTNEAAPLRVVNDPAPEAVIVDMRVDEDLIDEFPIPPQDLPVQEAAMAEHEIVAPIPIRVDLPTAAEEDVAAGTFVIGSDAQSSSDDADSEGPITPETHAVDNAAIVTASAKPFEEVTELNLAGTSPLPVPAVPAAENKDFVPPGLVRVQKLHAGALAPADNQGLVPPGLVHVHRWQDNALAPAGDQRLSIPQR